MQTLDEYPTSIESDQKLLMRSGVFPKEEEAETIGRNQTLGLECPRAPTLKGLELAAVSARWSEKKAVTSALYVIQHLRRKLNGDSKGMKAIIK